MKHTLYVIVIAVVAALSMASCKVVLVGDLGPMKTKAMKVQPFSSIDCGCPASAVNYIQADSFEVVVEAPEKLMAEIKVSDKNGTLTINKNDDDRLFAGNDLSDKIKITIKSPTLTNVEISGSANFYQKGFFKTNSLTLVTSGACVFNLDSVEINNAFDVEMSGAGHLKMKSLKAKTVSIDNSGAQDVTGKIIDADKIEVETSGAGHVKLNVSNVGSITGEVSGAGDVDVTGTAESFNVKVSGVGSASGPNIQKRKK